MDEDELREGIEQVCSSVLQRSDEGLFATPRELLNERYWYFKWDDKRSLAGNFYEFFDLLGLFSRFVRRWEEHHGSHVCVVERVRDQWLLPKIRDFMSRLGLFDRPARPDFDLGDLALYGDQSTKAKAEFEGLVSHFQLALEAWRLRHQSFGADDTASKEAQIDAIDHVIKHPA
jgi:hypothetical protein